MPTYAARTDVSPESSISEIRKTITRYGASSFMYGEEDTKAIVGFVSHDRTIRFLLPLPSRSERQFTHHDRGPRTPSASQSLYDQAVRQRWRALNLLVKAKLEAVESNISTFEQEFFANTVLPNGQTVYDTTAGQIDVALETGTVRPLLGLDR